jgi:hypothetical protein
MNYLIYMVDRLHQSQVNGIGLDPVTEYLQNSSRIIYKNKIQ